MRRADFETMIRAMADEFPPEFLEGVAEITVSPRTVPHPDREGIWTLGECIPLPGEDGDPRHLQSRVVLYHGSFQALAADTEGFDWRAEAWETLAHEVRHHVEWRARAPDLEAIDRAAEANYARQDGEPFDPHFYRDGERRPDGSWSVDGDLFIEREVAALPAVIHFRLAGEEYEADVPPDASLPAFLTAEGVRPEGEGEVVLVLDRRRRWSDLFRRRRPFQAGVEARRVSR